MEALLKTYTDKLIAVEKIITTTKFNGSANDKEKIVRLKTQRNVYKEIVDDIEAAIKKIIDLNGLEEMYDALFPVEIKKVKKERKSDVRVRIEQVLKGVKINHVFVDATSPKKNRYRMKFSCNQDAFTPLRKQLIEEIPGVVKVAYKTCANGRGYGFFNGICVYFDQKPSEIKL